MRASVQVVFWAFALLFFPFVAFCEDEQCIRIILTESSGILYASAGYGLKSTPVFIESPPSWSYPEAGPATNGQPYKHYYARRMQLVNGVWTQLNSSKMVAIGYPASGIVVPYGESTISFLNANYQSCPSECDLNDDDGDGICNTCDQLPGVPDKDDCLRGTSTNAAGEVTAAFIDKNCNGQANEWWTADNYSSEDRFIATIGDGPADKGKLNCKENCSLSDPCTYGDSSIGAVVSEMSMSGSPTPPSVAEMIDSLLDLPPPDQMPDRCDGHNQQCKEYCEDKLGVGMSYCYEKDGKKKSNCVCNNNFAYDMVTDSDTPAMEQADINKDSNGSGVPDYADDSILNQGDTDGDGITDKADVDHTGGQDSNGDGIDDAYTANAQASANASAGLSKSDSLNLDSIATSTAQTSAATQGLKTGIDKVVENTGDLKEKADAALAESQAIRAKLDSFNEDGTASLATQEGQLVDGLFPGIQPGDIPDDPTEDFDVDAFVQEFSFAFPDEVKTIIEGSSLQVQNPDSCVQGEIMGQRVQFCFDRFQAIFLAMGLLFKGLCVWRAIEIISVGVRG